MGMMVNVRLSARKLQTPVSTLKRSPFKDVARSNPHFDAIVALAGAGALTADPHGAFGPDLTFSRAEIAELLYRLMPRVALMANDPVPDEILVSPGVLTVAAVTITVPGTTSLVADAHQFVELHGRFNISGSGEAAGGPYDVFSYLEDEAGHCSFTYTEARYQAPVGSPAWEVDSGEVSWIFAASPGSHTYRLQASIDYPPAVPGSGLMASFPTLIAQTLPLGRLDFPPGI